LFLVFGVGQAEKPGAMPIVQW